MAKKCIYCNKRLDYTKNFCNENCEKGTSKYKKFEEKYKTFFGVLVALSLFLVFVSAVISTFNKSLGFTVAFSSVIFLGITISVFPFATEETFKTFGIKKTQIITRVLGAITAILGFSIIAI